MGNGVSGGDVSLAQWFAERQGNAQRRGAKAGGAIGGGPCLQSDQDERIKGGDEAGERERDSEAFFQLRQEKKVGRERADERCRVARSACSPHTWPYTHTHRRRSLPRARARGGARERDRGWRKRRTKRTSLFPTARRLKVECQAVCSGVYGSGALTGKSKNIAMARRQRRGVKRRLGYF